MGQRTYRNAAVAIAAGFLLGWLVASDKIAPALGEDKSKADLSSGPGTPDPYTPPR